MTFLIDHLDLRVRDWEACKPFYEALLPALGFAWRDRSDPAWLQFDAGPGDAVTPFVGVTPDPAHVPGLSRVAFRAGSREAVDALATLVRAAGARNVEGPGAEAAWYYAVFFEDPEGNRLEVCHRTRNGTDVVGPSADR